MSDQPKIPEAESAEQFLEWIINEYPRSENKPLDWIVMVTNKLKLRDLDNQIAGLEMAKERLDLLWNDTGFSAHYRNAWLLATNKIDEQISTLKLERKKL